VTFGNTLEKEEISRLLYGLCVEAQRLNEPEAQAKKQNIVVIAGPTACGKTEFAIQLAKQLGGEIVSADSMQVYKGMDIGTAKATPEQQKDVYHHLIDTRPVSQIFNVVDFYHEAWSACRNILSRNRVPIVVGGSGFYIHTFLYGPPQGPTSVPEVRQAIEKEIERIGIERAYDQLQELDPEYAKTITPHDRQKVIRALEILSLSGKSVSSLAPSYKHPPSKYNFHCWFLYRPREILYERINKRCEEMLEENFLHEVISMQKQGLMENSSACQAIGYRQALEYLDNACGEEDYLRFVEEFKKVSRRYAKKQFTWFRKEPLFRWLDLDYHDYETAQDMILAEYDVEL
jgi:tRNA dimethylallyltransferase